MVKKKSHRQFLYEFNALNSSITVLGKYMGTNSKITVKCDTCCLEWSPTPYNLLKGHGCPRCAGVMQKTHDGFVDATISGSPIREVY